MDGATQGTIICRNSIEDTGSGKKKIGVRIGKPVGQVIMEENTVKAETDVQDDRPRRP